MTGDTNKHFDDVLNLIQDVNPEEIVSQILLEKLAPKIKDFKFLCMDYRDVPLPDGCVVYCDPPYDGTKEYAGIKFDSNAFWDYMREISQNHLVFISELNAPDDFIPIWEKKVTRTLDVNKNNMFKSTEKIFIFNK